MKRLIPITASLAILALAAPFAASQWIEFSARNTTWKEDAELKRLQIEYAIAEVRAQHEQAQAAANRQAWHRAADEFYADPVSVSPHSSHRLGICGLETDPRLFCAAAAGLEWF